MQLFETLSSMSLATLEAAIPSVACGIALAAAISLVLKRTTSFNSATRFAVWAAALAVLPILTIGMLANRVKTQEPAAAPAVVSATISTAPLRRVAEIVAEAAPMPVSNSLTSPPKFDIAVPRGLPLILLGAYTVIVLLLLFRLLISYVRIRLLRRRSRPAPA